ncbi:MAG: SCO6880 family protein, partial [Acidimicrobiales bacterium]
MTTDDLSVRFGRRPARGLVLGLSPPRVMVLALAAAVAVAGLVADNGSGLLASAVLWGPLSTAAFVRVAGRPAVEWAGTGLHYGARRA